MHEKVKSLYSWHAVAKRTETVYRSVMERPKTSMLTRIKYSMSMGMIAGMCQVIVYVLHLAVMFLSTLVFPESSIDIAEDFPHMTYM